VSERREFAKGMHDRPFIRRQSRALRVRARPSGADRGVAGLRTSERPPEQNIRARFFEHSRTSTRLGLRGRAVAMEDGEGAEAIGAATQPGAGA